MSTLRVLRKNKGWSQENLYQALGVALEDVAKITIYSRADASLSFLRSRREKKGWSQQKLADEVSGIFLGDFE